jgi:teichuronic acid biosynthesis glycosyltransferase TuaG
LVSIITPAYNAERFIGESIRSVQAQDYDDWQMLVVDDGSSDNTCAIVRAMASADSRIRLLVPDEHGGPGPARNLALVQARSRYVYSAYEFIDENGDVLGTPVRVPATLDYDGVLKNTIIACLTVLVDRNQSGPLQMLPLSYQEDLSLWCSILKRRIVAHGVQEVLARYRVVRGSASRNKIRSALHMWKFYRQVEHLSLSYSCWCYGNYAWRAYCKNRKRM